PSSTPATPTRFAVAWSKTRTSAAAGPEADGASQTGRLPARTAVSAIPAGRACGADCFSDRFASNEIRAVPAAGQVTAGVLVTTCFASGSGAFGLVLAGTAWVRGSCCAGLG